MTQSLDWVQCPCGMAFTNDDHSRQVICPGCWKPGIVLGPIAEGAS